MELHVCHMSIASLELLSSGDVAILGCNFTLYLWVVRVKLVIVGQMMAE